MCLAFWRAGKDEAAVQRAIPKACARDRRSPVAASETGDLDLHALGQTLNRKRAWIILPTALAAGSCRSPRSI